MMRLRPSLRKKASMEAAPRDARACLKTLFRRKLSRVSSPACRIRTGRENGFLSMKHSNSYAEEKKIICSRNYWWFVEYGIFRHVLLPLLDCFLPTLQSTAVKPTCVFESTAEELSLLCDAWENISFKHDNL